VSDQRTCSPAPERFVSLLAERMRAAGATVGVGEVLAAHRALAVVPPPAARDALRAAVCSSRRDIGAFEEAWAALAAPGEPDPVLDDLMQTARAALPRAWIPSAERLEAAVVAAEPVSAAWSDEELLAHKDFAAYTDAERAAAR